MRLCTIHCDFCTSFAACLEYKGARHQRMVRGSPFVLQVPGYLKHLSFILMVIISFVFEGETSTMTLQPSLRRLQVLMQLAEDDAELDLGLAPLLQHRRRRRAPRRFWLRPWVLRRTDLGHYGRLMQELEAENREAFTNFLRVPSELFRELEHRLTPRLLKQDTWFREALKPRLKLAITLRY